VLPLGELAKCAVEFAELPRNRRVGGGYQRRRHLIDVDSPLFAQRMLPYNINI
jgi:hypothetical protein